MHDTLQARIDTILTDIEALLNGQAGEFSDAQQEALGYIRNGARRLRRLPGFLPPLEPDFFTLTVKAAIPHVRHNVLKPIAVVTSSADLLLMEGDGWMLTDTQRDLLGRIHAGIITLHQEALRWFDDYLRQNGVAAEALA